MLYRQLKFTLPANTKKMTKEEYDYALGVITAEEFEKITGKKPEG